MVNKRTRAYIHLMVLQTRESLLVPQLCVQETKNMKHDVPQNVFLVLLNESNK